MGESWDNTCLHVACLFFHHAWLGLQNSELKTNDSANVIIDMFRTGLSNHLEWFAEHLL